MSSCLWAERVTWAGVSLRRERGFCCKTPLERCIPNGGLEDPPQAPEQTFAAFARALNLLWHPAPCKKEMTCTSAWLGQHQPCLAPRLMSSPRVQIQPSLAGGNSSQGAVCRVRNPLGSRRCVCILTGMGTPEWHIRACAGMGGCDAPAVSGLVNPPVWSQRLLPNSRLLVP